MEMQMQMEEKYRLAGTHNNYAGLPSIFYY